MVLMSHRQIKYVIKIISQKLPTHNKKPNKKHNKNKLFTEREGGGSRRRGWRGRTPGLHDEEAKNFNKNFFKNT